MRRGQNAKVSKIRQEVSMDTDRFFIKNMKFYCKGRGCRHRGMPDYKPTAVCFYMKVKHKPTADCFYMNVKNRKEQTYSSLFYMKGSVCSHKEIKDRIEDVLRSFNGARIRIEEIQFVPLAVHLDSIESENRWVITLNSMEARNRVAGTTCHIRGQKVTLRRYDDIIQLEYRKCSRSTHLMSMVNKIKNLDNEIEDVEDTIKKSTSQMVESQIINSK